MFEDASAPTKRNALADWVLRGSVAAAFLLIGWEKCPSNPNGEWPRMFAQIGFGQWFRYCTGLVEMLGAALVLLPWTVNMGLAINACTMAGAALVHIFVLHHPIQLHHSGRHLRRTDGFSHQPANTMNQFGFLIRFLRKNHHDLPMRYRNSHAAS